MPRLLLLTLIASVLPAASLYLDRWRSVADALIKTPPDSYPFNWGEGVQMIGLMKVYERTRDVSYAGYVDQWAALYLDKDISELLNTGGLTKGTRPGYCGHWSPGAAILYLYQARGKPEHLDLARKVNAFIRNGAERSPEGALGHWIGSHQLWVDTLYMACPLLAGLAKLEGKPEYIDDAANQLIVFARHTQNERTGLFCHMWDWQTGQRTEEPWARGNGWVIMSLADTFEALPRNHPSGERLRKITLRLIEGILATQNSTGAWHTVMDDPSSYPESSATSMIAYALLKLARLGVIEKKYGQPARRAWSAVSEQYVKDGIVTGVSSGTGPQGGEHYRTRHQGTFTWGTGAYLMAGSEIHRLR